MSHETLKDKDPMSDPCVCGLVHALGQQPRGSFASLHWQLPLLALRSNPQLVSCKTLNGSSRQGAFTVPPSIPPFVKSASHGCVCVGGDAGGRCVGERIVMLVCRYVRERES